MEKIASYEVNYHPQSFADKATRVFWWNGEIYRGISPESAPFFRKLFQNGVIQKLTNQGFLIDSELTTLVLDEYEMVVRHKTIPFLSYPDEWCAAMYKEAALMSLDLAIELARWDLTLRDTHPWNVLFDVDDCKPYFVDWGSIELIQSSTWSDYNLFCTYFLHPLILMSHGEDRIARLLLSDEIGILKSDLSKFTANSSLPNLLLKVLLGERVKLLLQEKTQLFYSAYVRVTQKIFDSTKRVFQASNDPKVQTQPFSHKSHLKFLQMVKKQVSSIVLPDCKVKNTESSEQHNSAFLIQNDWTEKQKNIHKIIVELQPSSVLDIGCGAGWYSKLAAFLGSKVVSFDIDQTCITQLYYEARDRKLSILPLIMDFTKPTPGRGLADRAGIPATTRFQCDLVLALGLINLIVGKQCLNFDQIVEGLALFSKRWVIVEFVPFEAQDFEEWWLSHFSWYTLDNLSDALKKRFRHLTIMASHPESCVLLLCEK